MTTTTENQMPKTVRPGFVAHTELASSDPPATKAWCGKVLGWTFGEPMAIPGGEYHMWRHETGTGGGIRSVNPPEAPGTVPYVEVEDIQKSFDAAIRNGATVMVPPSPVPDGTRICVVQAPGGVPIGFWSPH